MVTMQYKHSQIDGKVANSLFRGGRGRSFSCLIIQGIWKCNVRPSEEGRKVDRMSSLSCQGEDASWSFTCLALITLSLKSAHKLE